MIVVGDKVIFPTRIGRIKTVINHEVIINNI